MTVIEESRPFAQQLSNVYFTILSLFCFKLFVKISLAILSHFYIVKGNRKEAARIAAEFYGVPQGQGECYDDRRSDAFVQCVLPRQRGVCRAPAGVRRQSPVGVLPALPNARSRQQRSQRVPGGADFLGDRRRPRSSPFRNASVRSVRFTADPLYSEASLCRCQRAERQTLGDAAARRCPAAQRRDRQPAPGIRGGHQRQKHRFGEAGGFSRSEQFSGEAAAPPRSHPVLSVPALPTVHPKLHREGPAAPRPPAPVANNTQELLTV
ncbi:ankyrin repeat and SOCS box protein 5 isoform X4 [Larus michahellis]|uniref:ankyrin repeat and SOCS box protein 5 isoform X4 n=1 Tax=Larus michahellis TaxID=119627 RepID=UPI003D9BC04C